VRDRSRERRKEKDRKRRKEEKRERRKRKEEKVSRGLKTHIIDQHAEWTLHELCDRRRQRTKKAAKKARKEGGSKKTFGYYGILNESDINTKDSEFRAWLIEERKMSEWRGTSEA